MGSLLRAFAVWLLLMAAEVVHGTLRTILVEPRMGAASARRLSVFTGSALILTLVWLVTPWLRARRPILTGLFWVALTVPFEVGLGRAFGRPWEEIGADFDLRHGGLLPLGLLVMLFSVWIARRIDRGPMK